MHPAVLEISSRSRSSSSSELIGGDFEISAHSQLAKYPHNTHHPVNERHGLLTTTSCRLVAYES
jgi:hypothetical protein